MLYAREAYAYRMRRLILVFSILATFVLAPAAAAQQRDPFDPVIDPNPGAGVPQGSPEEAPVFLPVPDPDEPLPETGDAGTSSYLGSAYLLITIGAMVVMLGKINSAPTRR